ncbi:MAG: nodulation protein NfeD [Candidatus Latescibacteria bacterium]|nr:nodulation protein NfeD [Candidatus Latescibacterota bacterium]
MPAWPTCPLHGPLDRLVQRRSPAYSPTMRIPGYLFWLIGLLPVGVSAQTVYHLNLQLEGMIDPGIAAFVERVVEDAEDAGADALVLEIDTFGGRVDAATVIRDALLDATPLTIAFVNKRAISAGALISLACDKIVMTRAATIGAATAVDGSGEKGSDKVISYFRAEMRATAERTGRDPKIAEAMVEDEIYIPGLSDEAGQPATLTTDQALHYQIAEETAESLQDVLAIYDLSGAEIVPIELNWSERIVRFLTHPIVTSILLAVAMFGLIAEVRTPGWGLGGTLAIAALALFFGSNFIVRLAEWTELLIVVVGVVLLIVEVVVIPGFGLVGLAGIFCILAGLLLAQLPTFELLTFDDFSQKVSYIALSLIGAVVMSALFLRALPHLSAFRRLVLETETRASQGYVSAPTEGDADLVGRQGVSLSYLRPVGVALVDGRRLDVIAEGEFIQAQTPIKIVEARGHRIVVRSL